MTVLPEPDEICRLSARELARRYASRELSPVDVLEAVVRRAEAVDPHVSALYWRLDEAARAAAASQERWARGEPLSELDGLPITAKDNLDVPGAPTYRGSRTNLFAPLPTEADPLVHAFVERGAVLWAKSTMVETGFYSASISALYGPARNPWNLAKSPGGSTSGGAAATAAYLGPVHLGTDGGGSLRSPAGSCGCVALKPTAQLAPFGSPPGDLPASAGVSGFLTRDVADQVFVFERIGAVDARAASPSRPLDELRIGYLSRPTDDPGVGDVQPIVRAAIEHAVDRLGDGLRIEEATEPVFVGPLWEQAVVAAFEQIGRRLDALPPQALAGVHPVVRDTVARVKASSHGAAPGATLPLLRELLAAGGRSLGALLERYDLLLLACNYYPSFDAERPWHDDCAVIERAGYGWTSGACPHFGWAHGGPPGVNVPCGLDADGVPIGLLVIGRPGCDLAVLAAAREIERRLEFAWPEVTPPPLRAPS